MWLQCLEKSIEGRRGGSGVMAVMQAEDAVAWSGVAVLGLARGHCILTCSEGGARSASWQIGCAI